MPSAVDLGHTFKNGNAVELALTGLAVGDWLVLYSQNRTTSEADRDPTFTFSDVTFDGDAETIATQVSWRDGRLRDLRQGGYARKVLTVGATPTATATWSGTTDGFYGIAGTAMRGFDRITGKGGAVVLDTDGPADLTMTALSGESVGAGQGLSAIGAKDGNLPFDTMPTLASFRETAQYTNNFSLVWGAFADGNSSTALTYEGSGSRGLNLMGFAFGVAAASSGLNIYVGGRKAAALYVKNRLAAKAYVKGISLAS